MLQPLALHGFRRSGTGDYSRSSDGRRRRGAAAGSPGAKDGRHAFPQAAACACIPTGTSARPVSWRVPAATSRDPDSHGRMASAREELHVNHPIAPARDRWSRRDGHTSDHYPLTTARQYGHACLGKHTSDHLLVADAGRSSRPEKGGSPYTTTRLSRSAGFLSRNIICRFLLLKFCCNNARKALITAALPILPWTGKPSQFFNPLF
jgi:hypothetical protein